MLAAITSIQRLRVPKDQARELSKALSDVSKHYNLPGISDKHQAIGGLIVCAFGIYGPMALDIKAGRLGAVGQAETPVAQPFVATPSNVVQMTAAGATPAAPANWFDLGSGAVN